MTPLSPATSIAPKEIFENPEETLSPQEQRVRRLLGNTPAMRSQGFQEQMKRYSKESSLQATAQHLDDTVQDLLRRNVAISYVGPSESELRAQKERRDQLAHAEIPKVSGFAKIAEDYSRFQYTERIVMARAAMTQIDEVRDFVKETGVEALGPAIEGIKIATGFTSITDAIASKAGDLATDAAGDALHETGILKPTTDCIDKFSTQVLSNRYGIPPKDICQYNKDAIEVGVTTLSTPIGGLVAKPVETVAKMLLMKSLFPS